jgi:hypothetical protein
MLCHGYPRGTIAGSRISLSSFLAAACVTMATGNHAAAQTVTLDLPAMSLPLHAIVGTGRQQEWLDASINERVKLAEAIGEEGARELSFGASKPATHRRFKTSHHVGGIGRKNPLVRTCWQGVMIRS